MKPIALKVCGGSEDTSTDKLVSNRGRLQIVNDRDCITDLGFRCRRSCQGEHSALGLVGVLGTR